MSQAAPTGPNQARGFSKVGTRGTRQGFTGQRKGFNGIRPRTDWAEPAPLVRNREAVDKAKKEFMKNRKEQYLEPSEPEEEFAGMVSNMIEPFCLKFKSIMADGNREFFCGRVKALQWKYLELNLRISMLSELATRCGSSGTMYVDAC